jgi:hypothetical protein
MRHYFPVRTRSESDSCRRLEPQCAGRTAEIVGLVRDAYYHHSRELPPSTVYISLGALSNGTLDVRPAGGLLKLVSVLREAVNGCDRNYHRALKELQRLPVQSKHCRRSPQSRTSISASRPRTVPATRCNHRKHLEIELRT